MSNSKFSSFTAWTTRVSNPVCSPRFRVSVSVIVQEVAFASGIPSDIYAFYRYTGNSTSPYNTLVKKVLNAIPRLSLGISHLTILTTYTPFTPNNSD